MKKKSMIGICALSVSLLTLSGNAGVQAVLAAENQQAQGSVSEDIFVSNEGREIPATVVLPEGDGPFPLVVMNHGFAGSRNEGNGFTSIAETLAENGIATVRLDFAGCGDSSASFLEFNLENNRSDSMACLNYVKDNYPIDEERLGIFGYSMGGRMTLCINQSEENPYKAMALLAPAAAGSGSEFEQQQKENLQKAQEGDGSVEIEWYGANLQVSEEYYTQVLDSMEIMDQLAPVTASLVIYGDEDVMVEPEICKTVAEKINAETVEIPGADHGYAFYQENEQITEQLETSLVDFFEREL